MAYNKRAEDLLTHAKSELDSALWDFEHEKNNFQTEVRYTTINISTGDFSKLYSILSKIKRAAEGLYSTCESLVRTLDREFTQLGNDLSADYIRRLVELLKEINENANISIKFDGMLDGHSLGDLGRMEYSPSLDAQSIVKTWESKYKLSPEYAEAERRRREEAAERVRRREEAAKAQREREKKQKEEEEKRKKQKEKKKKEAENHKKDFSEQCSKAVEQFRTALAGALQKKVVDLRRDREQELSKLQEQKTELELTLSTYGAFQFSAKRELKQQLKEINSKIAQYSDEKVINQEQQRLQELMDTAVKKYSQQIEAYLASRFYYEQESKNAIQKIKGTAIEEEYLVLSYYARVRRADYNEACQEMSKYTYKRSNSLEYLLKDYARNKYLERTRERGSYWWEEYVITEAGKERIAVLLGIEGLNEYSENPIMANSSIPSAPTVQSVIN